jgi:mevalonyl-CoA ligase
VTLLNFAYTPLELRHALSSTKAKLLITTTRSGKYNYSDVLRSLENTFTYLSKVILLQDTMGADEPVSLSSSLSSSFFWKYSDLLHRGSRTPTDWTVTESRISCLDILNLQFTSGSTGAPKAAALTHSGLLNSALYIGQNLGINGGDKIVIPVPLFHSFGLIMGKDLDPNL